MAGLGLKPPSLDDGFRIRPENLLYQTKTLDSVLPVSLSTPNTLYWMMVGVPNCSDSDGWIQPLFDIPELVEKEIPCSNVPHYAHKDVTKTCHAFD
jgi:hypothetical protein